MKRMINSKQFERFNLFKIICMLISFSLLIVGLIGCSDNMSQAISSAPDLSQASSLASSSDTASNVTENSTPVTEPSKAEGNSLLESDQLADSTKLTVNSALNNNTQTYEKILIPAFISGITAASWKSAEEILPDQLVTFFVLDFMEKQNPNGWNGIKEVPAEEVECEIQKHFDVSTEHLRQAEAYSKEKNVYTMGYGFGGGADFYVTKVYPKGLLTYVEFEYKNVDVVIRKGTIVLDTTGEDCRYISCVLKKIEQ